MNKKEKIPLLLFMKIKLQNKYNISNDFYNKKKINELIFNDPSNYTAAFKEYLLLEDENEFLRRFYKKNELKKKLSSIYNFYEKYSKIFPNYIIIQESKFMYKNIQKKQKMIDNLQYIKEQEKRNKERKKNTSNDTIFTNGAINDIFNQTDSYYKNNLKNLIDITFTNDDTVKDINNLIKKIEKNEEEKKTSYINLIINKKNKKLNSDFSTMIQTLKNESKKNNRNLKTNISNPLYTDYLSNKSNVKKQEIHSQKYPTITVSNSKKKLKMHQKVNSQNGINNLNNIKKKILQLDNKNYNFNYHNNFDSKNIIKMLNSIDKKNKTKYKENFSTCSNLSSSRQKNYNKHKSSNSNNKMTTLSNSPRNNFLTDRIEKKLFSKKVFSRNHNDSKKKNLLFHNSVLTDNLANYTKNKLLFEQNNSKLKIKKSFKFFNQK